MLREVICVLLDSAGCEIILIAMHQSCIVIFSSLGSATVNSIFSHYDVVKPSDFAGLKKGKLVSMATGKSSGFALDLIQERGALFIGLQEDVYEGMVIGE